MYMMTRVAGGDIISKCKITSPLVYGSAGGICHAAEGTGNITLIARAISCFLDFVCLLCRDNEDRKAENMWKKAHAQQKNRLRG